MAKVEINGPSKLIIVNDSVTEIDVKVDLYSEWKLWVIESDNSKYVPAFSAIGGDPLPGGKFVGTTFFLENGWKIRPFEGDHDLVVSGNLYDRTGGSPFVNTVGDYNVLITMATSNLVDAVATSGSTGPTASSIADAVWDKLAISGSGSGSFGEFVNMIKASTEATSTDIYELKTMVETATAMVNTLLKYEKNRTRVDQAQKTLTVYEDDGVTPLKVFDLKDYTGASSITTIAERAPR